MTFKDEGFRLFYKNFCAIKLNDKTVPALKDYPDAEKATHVLVYGYIDREKGIMLEVIAGGKKDAKGYRFFDASMEIRSMIGVDAVEEEEVDVIDDGQRRLAKRYEKKLELLHVFDVSEDLEQSRGFEFIDHLRDNYYPDGLRVFLLKEGLEPEPCWVGLTGLGEDHTLIGVLTEEPQQDFGCHKGRTLVLRLGKQDDTVYCAADFDSDALAIEEEEVGESEGSESYLKDKIVEFYQDQNQETYNTVMNTLCYSDVYVPLHYSFDEGAIKILERMKKQGKQFADLSDKDKERVHEGASLKPFILSSEDKNFMAIFSTEEEIGDNIEHEECHKMLFGKILHIAMDWEEDELAGIVIDPFSSAFEVPADLFEKLGETAFDVEKSIENEDKDIQDAVKAFHEDRNSDTYSAVISLLADKKVHILMNYHLSDVAEKIRKKAEADGKDLKDLSEADQKKFEEGINLLPYLAEHEDKAFLAIFSAEKEIPEDLEFDTKSLTPFGKVLKLAIEMKEVLEGIVLNPYTETFVIGSDDFENILAFCQSREAIDENTAQGEPGGEDTVQKKRTVTAFSNVGKALTITANNFDTFSFLLYENKVAPIRGIQIQNRTGNEIYNITLKISCDSGVFETYEQDLLPIPSGKPIALEDPHLVINSRMLAELIESQHTVVTVELCEGEKSLCGIRADMELLPYNQLHKSISWNFLPSFVMPNHPVVVSLLHDAVEILKKQGKDPSLEGYQSDDPKRIREFAEAIYIAIKNKSIYYSNPPAGVAFYGQRIRTPDMIMEQKLGTCMDMALLYASCLEAMLLHPVLLLQKGHIFTGVWLKKRSGEELMKSGIINHNLKYLTMNTPNGANCLTFVECTKMCVHGKESFKQAERIALEDELPDREEFECSIDVFLARCQGIKPLPARLKKDSEYMVFAQEAQEREKTSSKIIALETATQHQATKRNMTKKELWEGKLLDLSRHNMLLNLPVNASVEPIMSSHIDELEDSLADGHEFNIYATPQWRELTEELSVTVHEGKKEKHLSLYQLLLSIRNSYYCMEFTDWPANQHVDLNERLRQEFKNHRLYAFCTETQLNRDLTQIYRAARSSQQENGVSSLYLAIGLLRWFEDSESNEPNYAPLILQPVEIVRKSANQGYALHSRDEEPHFNATLLELLKQNYNLEIGGLDPLPTDDHGTDIRKVFSIVRNAVYTIPNWDVVETAVIGNFSFAQFAMWNDIHTAGEKLDNSKIVRSLMKGHVDWDTSFPKDQSEKRTYLPITVDATQLQAINRADSGSTFVLHGPPGTGKSQTITAMIANLLAQNKTVLFVAEKMAALSVVEKRLTGLGIGDFCLELHSDKANKKQVLSQLEKALSVKKPENQTNYEAYWKQAAASRAKLDDYARHLHAVQPNGYSLRELIDLYETVRTTEHAIRFDRKTAQTLTKAEINRHLPLIGQLIAAGNALDDEAVRQLQGVELNAYSAEVRSSVRLDAEIYLNALEMLEQKSEAAAQAMKVSEEEKNNPEKLLQLAKMILNTAHEDPVVKAMMSCDQSEIAAYYQDLTSLEKEKNELLQLWKPELLDKNLADFRERYEAAGKKLFGKSASMAAIVGELQKSAVIGIDYDQIPKLLDQAEQYQKHCARLDQKREKLDETAKQIVSQIRSEEEYHRKAKDATDQKTIMEKFLGGIEMALQLAKDKSTAAILQDYVSSYDKVIAAEEKLNQLLNRKMTEYDEAWVEREKAFCFFAMRRPAALKDWSIYNKIRRECLANGLLPVVETYEKAHNSEGIENAYKKGLYYALINEAILNDDVLSSFSGATFNESIQQFKKIDAELLKVTRQEIYYLLASRVPTAWDSPEVGMELNLLRKAISSNARGMSIRKLFERIPHVLQNLCPCMLMSPNSVAQYLEQKNDLFDVVIFDEASQLPTCKSVGALYRGKDAVIVGDPKQMPPTSFFAGGGPVVEDIALDDLDSILDDALALGIPSQHLQWHYRSTHESLIAFSNSEFYDNKMFTFPSANDRERHVTAVHVKGVYKNSTNIKEAETVVAEIVRRYRNPELRDQSIGVVTFNVKQQTLIENLLAKQFQKDQKMDAWANNGEDPIFVKNLENVQGDERDVILFSIGYGPDEKGKISMNFGPINQQGGGKRLNVAFSRARVTMTIFTSMYSTDIKVTESSPEGLVAFRDFLKFAEGGNLGHGEGEKEHAAAKAGIMQNICSEIEKQGLQCEMLVGHSDFHVDIAVVNPYEPTKYLMGILLDGDGYRQTKNTRDREIAQIGVLKNLGWSIHRIWAMDWWDNRENEIRKLLNALDKQKEKAASKAANRSNVEQQAEQEKKEAEKLEAELASQAAEVISEDEAAEQERLHRSVQIDSGSNTVVSAAVNTAKRSEPDQTATADDKAETLPDKKPEQPEVKPEQEKSVEEPTVTYDKSRPVANNAVGNNVIAEPVTYETAELPETKLSQAEFASYSNRAEIGKRALIVVEKEGPILKETLIKRLLTSFGVGKTTAALEALEKGLKSAKIKNSKVKGIVFCWAPDQDPKDYTGIRVSNERSGDEISPQEIKNAAVYVLSRTGPMEKDDLIKAISVLFGYKRLGKNLEVAIANGLSYAKSNDFITLEGRKFSVANQVPADPIPSNPGSTATKASGKWTYELIEQKIQEYGYTDILNVFRDLYHFAFEELKLDYVPGTGVKAPSYMAKCKGITVFLFYLTYYIDKGPLCKVEFNVRDLSNRLPGKTMENIRMVIWNDIPNLDEAKNAHLIWSTEGWEHIDLRELKDAEVLCVFKKNLMQLVEMIGNT